MVKHVLLITIVAYIAVGCQSNGRKPLPPGGDPEPASTGDAPQALTQSDSGSIVAYVAGEPLGIDSLVPELVEASGGEVFADRVLQTMLARRLDQSGLVITDEALAAEQEIITQALSEDPDESARLLSELRARRGLGDVRFAGLLERNAGLRLLVADRVTVSEDALQQAFRLRYGPSSRVRLLLVENLGEAQRLRKRAVDGGEAFGELAALHSTDASAAQGGLLSPIREDDTRYPAALRNAVAKLGVGEVSPPVGLDGGFALLWLEQKNAGQKVSFDDVKAKLVQDVRRRSERVLMQQVARELISAAEVVVLDPDLKSLWEAQRQSLLRPQ